MSQIILEPPPDPGDLAGHISLSAGLNAQGQLAEAARLLRRTLALFPGAVEAWSNFAFNRLASGAADDSLAAAKIAASIDPCSVVGQINLAAALDALGSSEAGRAVKRAVSLAPSAAPALQARLRSLSRTSAWALFETWGGRTRAVAPDAVETALALSHGYLAQGDMRRGWKHWEDRLPRSGPARPGLQGSRWQGEPVTEDTIVAYAEQGIGDSIQYLRFVPRLTELGGHVVLRLPGELASLAARSFASATIYREDAALPSHRWHCALPSLAAILNVELSALPGRIPYLAADAAVADWWRGRLSERRRPWIGLCWRGNPRYGDDRLRSPGLSPFFEMLGRSRATFVSLTKHPAAHERDKPAALIDVGDRLATFDDTAALISALDLVITSDTAVAHLAGALAKPTWLLLHHAPDWRWLETRSDSPWYPTMRLFRQPAPGDWTAVVDAVRRALER
jgi:hypothetical protein